MVEKVLVTGGFGNVGKWVIRELISQNYSVVALSRPDFGRSTAHIRKKRMKIASKSGFEIVWGDLRNEEQVVKAVTIHQPDAIIHLAAITPPDAYVYPNRAYQVNVKSMGYLLGATKKVANLRRFVFISSYIVHGPRNPFKKLEPLTGDSEVNPQDNYGKHKIIAENMLSKTDLDWVIIRLPMVLILEDEYSFSPNLIKFNFLLDPNRNESGIDVRDAALCITNALSTPAIHRIFSICGDPNKGWHDKARVFQTLMYKIKGLSPLPESAFRLSDPKVDASWYYEDFVDPHISEAELKYQRYSLEESTEDAIKAEKYSRFLMKMISPFITRYLVKNFRIKHLSGKFDIYPIWDRFQEIFSYQDTNLNIKNDI